MNEQIDEILQIAKFLDEQHYPKTSTTIISLVEMLARKKKIVGFENFAKRVASIVGIFRDEWVNILPFGQDYRGACFDEALMTLLQALNNLGEKSKEISTEFMQFMSRIDEIDESIKPMSELFANLLVKRDRSMQDSLVMFHSACYIYLIGVEGIFDDLVKMLYILAEASKGNIRRFEEVEVDNIWNIRSAYKQLFGISPVFLERWQEKGDIRNAIAHAQARYYPKTNRVHFRSVNIKDGRIFDKTMDFDEFQALHMEIIDAIDSFKYSLRIIRVSALLVDSYKYQINASSS